MNITRWGFMHVIATNLCIWISTLTAEIMHASNHHDDHGDYNVTQAPASMSTVTVLCTGHRGLVATARFIISTKLPFSPY